jgi:RHS repeat-associated protein
MIAEANDATGAMIREYIWMDDTPVAMVDDTGTNPVVYDIHADHLGGPQKLTDQSANLAWDGVFDPFGNPSSIGGSLTMLLGFPGQYWDSETQLAQNWHRDYDPTIGRYIESDPIGLWGGVNTYDYVADKPLRYVDMEGTGPLGGIIGGGLGAALGGAGGTAVEPGGGTVVGGIEGWEEGYAIGSDIEDVTRFLMSAKSNTGGTTGFLPVGQSEPCQNHCDEQQEDDETDCWNNYGSVFGASDWRYRGCMERALERWIRCKKGLPDDLPPWSDADADGFPTIRER